MQVEHQPNSGRFIVRVDGQMGELVYEQKKDQLIFTHTGVPPALEGRGIGGQLVRAGLDYARENKLRVVPLCSFVAAYIRRHSEYQDLVEN